jgi:AsmA-like C-terminal region
MHRIRRALLWLCAAAAALLLLLLGVLLSAPWWVNSEAVKARIAQAMDRAGGGSFRFERMDLRFLPRPGGELVRPRVSVPGRVEAEARALSVDLALLPLAVGRIEPRNVRVSAPKLSLRIPKPSPGGEPFSVPAAEARLRAALENLFQRAPGLEVEVDDGAVDLHIGERPALFLRQVQVRLAVSSGLAAQISCASALSKRMALELQLARTDLSGAGKLEMTGLDLAQLGALFGEPERRPLREGEIDAGLTWTMRGLTEASVEARVTAPAFRLGIGSGEIALRRAAAQVHAEIKSGSLDVTLDRFESASPRLVLTGKLVRASGGDYALEARAQGVDLAQLQAAVHRAVPDEGWSASPPVVAEAGIVTELTLSSRAPAPEALFRAEALVATASVHDAVLFVPDADIRVSAVAGTVAYDRGALNARQVTARLGRSVLQAGSVATRFDVAPAPLRMEAAAVLDLAEALAVVKKVVHDREARRRLDAIRHLAGSAAVRVVLGDTLPRLDAEVEVSEPRIAVLHRDLPFPVSVSAGRFGFKNGVVWTEAAAGKLGRSSFGGVTARLSVKAPYALRVERATADLAVAELFHWASSQPSFAPVLEEVRGVSGSLDVTAVAFDGAAGSPAEASFHIAAAPRQLLVDAPRYGPALTLDGGALSLTRERAGATNVRVTALDAALEVSGGADGYREGVERLQATAAGTLGPKATDWVHERLELPARLRLRAPVALAEASFAWDRRGGTDVGASLKLSKGPAISFAVHAAQDRFEVKRLTLRDAASDASAAGNLEGHRAEIRFKGRLAGATIEQIFVQPGFSLANLQGDLSAKVDLDRPSASTAQGVLRGAQVELRALLPLPLTVEHFALEAKGATVEVRSAAVVSGESRVNVSGRVTHAADAFVVDADVRGPQVVVPAPAEDVQDARGEQAKQPSESLDIPVTGNIRIDLERMRVEGREIAPLIADVQLRQHGFDLNIQRAALCGVAMSGGLTRERDQYALQAALVSRDAAIEASIDCLTEKRIQITGNLDFDAHVAAHGSLNALRKALQGDFRLVARDGRIQRFDTLAKAFALLNVSEVVRGKLPDLKQSGLAYQRASAKGRIAGSVVHFDEALLDAEGVKVVGEGNVDYTDRRIHATLLVAPFKTVDFVVSKIPLIGRILGGTLIALPVTVTGTLENPVVVPLGPQAVASRLVDIIANTVKLPASLIQMIAPRPAPAQP